MNLTRNCFYCGSALDPLEQSTLQRIVGWQRKSHIRSSGKHGGSDIFAREPREEYAHFACVERRRNGVIEGQAVLL